MTLLVQLTVINVFAKVYPAVRFDSDEQVI
jgi:hypothetical protein